MVSGGTGDFVLFGCLLFSTLCIIENSEKSHLRKRDLENLLPDRTSLLGTAGLQAA